MSQHVKQSYLRTVLITRVLGLESSFLKKKYVEIYDICFIVFQYILKARQDELFMENNEHKIKDLLVL